MTLLLGLDVGTTSVKVGLFDGTGRLLATKGEEYRLEHPTPERAELDAETYWSATVRAVRATMAAAGPFADAGDVGAIGVSSQGETVVAVDARGRPLAPALIWLDNRAAEEARELRERFGDEAVYERTGIPAVNPTWPATKLLWWRRHEPEVFRSAARFLLVEDLVLHRLSGRFVSDGAVQSSSLLYDIVRRRWWEEMLDAVGVDERRLPELVPPGSIVGTLTRTAAEALGLPSSVRVVAGGMDQCAGAIGVGNVDAGVISESTGGALTLQASVSRADGDPTRQTPVYQHSVAGRYLYCPVCQTGGMALTWFRDRFGSEEMAAAEASGRSAYDLLTQEAGAVPPGAEGLTMLPHLMGAFSPEYDPEAKGVFYGFTLRHGKPHFIRAVLEAVAFMLRRNLELLGSAGAHADEIRSHGGGARSALWNQIKADVCDRPVVTLDGEDAAVRGDAMLAGAATGAFTDLPTAAAAMISMGGRYEPDPAARAAYDEAYARYLALFDALQPLFHETQKGGTGR